MVAKAKGVKGLTAGDCIDNLMAIHTLQGAWLGQLKEITQLGKSADVVDAVAGRLSARARGMLRRLGVRTRDELLNLTADDCRGLKNCGEKTVKEIQRLQKKIKRQHV